jgi:glycosyltransferase involved in cell wall biosynthesis
MTKLAILVPAYNEEQTIKDVILDFHIFLSQLNYDYSIYVIDNNSNDKTNIFAKQVIEENHIPAEVLFVKRQGKDNAVR